MEDHCAKVDKVMSELRRDLEIIGPGERTVTIEDLCLVVSNLNSRIMHSKIVKTGNIFRGQSRTKLSKFAGAVPY